MDFHTSEYLAGSLFRNVFFPGTNMTGAQHMAKGRDFVMQWMDRRYHWGFQVRLPSPARRICFKNCTFTSKTYAVKFKFI